MLLNITLCLIMMIRHARAPDPPRRLSSPGFSDEQKYRVRKPAGSSAKLEDITMKSLVSRAAGILFLGLAVPALAHHSFAMFDQSRKVSIQGTIADIQWTNPHVWIEVNVEKEDGSLELW